MTVWSLPRSRAKPRTAVSVPSVTMKGGSLRSAIKDAVDRSAGEAGEQTRRAGRACPNSGIFETISATMADAARIEPTERSMPGGQDDEGHAGGEHDIDRSLLHDDRQVLPRRRSGPSASWKTMQTRSSTGSMPSVRKPRPSAAAARGGAPASDDALRLASRRALRPGARSLDGSGAVAVRHRWRAAMIASCVSGGPLAGSSSPTILPPRITSTRSATPMISGSSDEMKTIPIPLAGELVHDPVDFRLCADVDAARRLVEDDDPRFRLRAGARGGPSAGCRRRASPPRSARACGRGSRAT